MPSHRWLLLAACCAPALGAACDSASSAGGTSATCVASGPGANVSLLQVKAASLVKAATNEGGAVADEDEQLGSAGELSERRLAAAQKAASRRGAYSVTARVLLDEGGGVGSSFYISSCPAYPEECEAICNSRAGCHSFSYSSEPWNCRCYFKDKCVSSTDPIVATSAPNHHYRTYYRPCSSPSSYSVTERVVQDEGGGLGDPTNGVTNPETCESVCDQRPGCHSFAYSQQLEVCWYKDKCVSPSDPIVGPNAPNNHFRTYYKACAPQPTSSPTSAPTTAVPTPSPTDHPTASPTRSPTPSPTPSPSPVPPGQLSSVVATYGRLAVSGTKIVSSNTGEVVRLKGMSFFWSQWGGTWYNRAVVRWLVQDWKVTVLRAAMGIRDDGYLGHPDREKQKVIEVADACIEAGIYVIIDWHVDGTDTPYADRAKVFFEEMTQRYGSSPHVMWEPWNEPQGNTDWLTQIKPYHEMMVPLIRQRSPDNIIILGSRSWCQEVGEASRNPVVGSNLVYALHFYATHHDEAERNKAREALSNGVAIFATEWGTPSYTCTGGINWEKVKAWTDFLEENDISDAGWSVNDKDETCSALKPYSNSQGSWVASELTESGAYFRGAIRALNW